jgi:hypothetical protein
VVNDGSAAKLIGGSLIGASQSFSSVKSWIEYRVAAYDAHCVFYGGESGNWPPLSRGYLGLAFLIDGKIHYGWAAMIVKGEQSPGVFLKTTLTGYAYQTKVGKSIMAGQR